MVQKVLHSVCCRKQLLRLPPPRRRAAGVAASASAAKDTMDLITSTRPWVRDVGSGLRVWFFIRGTNPLLERWLGNLLARDPAAQESHRGIASGIPPRSVDAFQLADGLRPVF